MYKVTMYNVQSDNVQCTKGFGTGQSDVNPASEPTVNR